TSSSRPPQSSQEYVRTVPSRLAVRTCLPSGVNATLRSRAPLAGGIEIDQTAPSSPRGTTILAEIPNLYGPGFTAQMTYYETPVGAKVFAAGAFTLAGSRAICDPQVSQLLENLLSGARRRSLRAGAAGPPPSSSARRSSGRAGSARRAARAPSRSAGGPAPRRARTPAECRGRRRARRRAV